MAKSASKSLQVFIGCPADLALERDALLASRDHIESVVCPVKFTTWRMSAPGVGEAQRVIFANDPVESFDIVIILLWSRLGVPSGLFDPLTKAEMTGTEAEFVSAYDLHQSHGKRRPQVLLYRCARKAEIDPNSSKLAELMAQLQAVQQFFKQTEKDGLRPMLVQVFETADQLTKMVERDIKTAAGRLRAASRKPSTPTRKSFQRLTAANRSELIHRYFAGLRDQFSIYENIGLPSIDRDPKEGEKDAPIPIRRLFVPPACTKRRFSPEAFEAALRQEKKPAEPLLPRLLPGASRTVLLADPGMGKSTLVQWLISTLADEAAPAEALRGAVPLPFVLRELVAHLPQEEKSWSWDALVRAFGQWRHRGRGSPLAAPLAADDALFRSILASPDAFFLIDGLDEIGDSQRRTAVRDAIWEGFEKYPKSRWLITSRIVGYEQAEVHQKFVPRDKASSERGRPTVFLTQIVDGRMEKRDGFEKATLLYLAPFEDAQQLAFARNWYVPRLGDAAGTQRADDFIAAVHRNDHTRVISRVPNLLYLLALLFRHRARLPDGRALVYAAISSAYLADIDLGRHLPDSLIVPWKFEEKEDLLALIAIRMQEIRVAQTKSDYDQDAKNARDETLVSLERLEKLLAASLRGGGDSEVQDVQDIRLALTTDTHDEDTNDARGEILVTRAQLEEWLAPRFGGVGDATACAELHRFLHHIANRSGLLLPRGEDVFGFAHLSFQEYYAACFLEKEFQRILTEKSQSAADDIFGTPSAAAKKDEEKMFAEMAGFPAWHEPLLFLVEKLRYSAPYTSRILAWTFPQLATEPKIENQGNPDFPVEEWMPLTAAQLLAGISLDQEITLDHAQRARIWRNLWRAQIARFDGKRLFLGWNIAPFLTATGSTYHNDVFQAAAALKPANLYLGECTALSDLKPLSAFTSLNTLVLRNCTAISDLNPLSGLVSLNFLDLSGCTAVRDLKPLSSLTSLNSLNLSGCTAVRDLKPLSSLASLTSLDLTGCIAASPDAVVALQASLPKLSIEVREGGSPSMLTAARSSL